MADCSGIRKFKDADDYRRNFVVRGEVDRYLPGGRHFIDEARISRCIDEIAAKPADPVRVREIIAKAEASCETLQPEETAALMAASADPALFETSDGDFVGSNPAGSGPNIWRSSIDS